jgi:hypothetical protein
MLPRPSVERDARCSALYPANKTISGEGHVKRDRRKIFITAFLGVIARTVQNPTRSGFK